MQGAGSNFTHLTIIHNRFCAILAKICTAYISTPAVIMSLTAVTALHKAVAVSTFRYCGISLVSAYGDTVQ